MNITAENFRTLCAEKNAKSVDDLQHRRIPELVEGQVHRHWAFSTARDMRGMERLIGQWGSATNLSCFVLSDETGVATQGGGLFGGMFYRQTGSNVYSTPLHGEVFETADGKWTATVRYEHTMNPPWLEVDFVIEVRETVDSSTRLWVFKKESVSKINETEEVIVGSNFDIDSIVEGTIYLNDVSVGTANFIPVAGALILSVPERYNMQTIDGPQIDDEELVGVHRSTSITSIKRRRLGSKPNDKQFVLLQILRRWYNDSLDYSKVGTQWRIRNGEAYHSGATSVVLELTNVDPSTARTLSDSLPTIASTFTNEIYTLTDGLLEGTWYNRHSTYEIEEDGSATILWMQSIHNNDDFWVGHKAGLHASSMDFYKVGATESSKADFLANYYFDPDLNFYYREASSGPYTKKNGVTGSGAMPSSAVPLDTALEGRTSRIRSSYDSTKDEWFIEATIHWGLEDTRFAMASRFASKLTPIASITYDSGYGITRATMNTLEGYYSSIDSGVTRNIDFSKNEDGTYDYEAVEVTVAGFVMEYKLGATMVYMGHKMTMPPTTDAARYNTYPDGTYHLLGKSGSWPTATTSIDTSINIQALARYNEQDDTWSWNIPVTEPESNSFEGTGGNALINYGYPEKEDRFLGWHENNAAPNGLDLVGDHIAVTVTIGATPTELTGRQVSVRSVRGERFLNKKISYAVYETIFTAPIEEEDEWFFVGAAAGFDRNKRVLLSGSSKGIGTSAAGDASYGAYGFASSATDNAIFNLAQNTIRGESSGVGEFPAFHIVEHATVRKRSVARYRKFFTRNPTDSDLTAAGIKSEMTEAIRVTLTPIDGGTPAEVANPLIGTTFDIRRINEHLWVVEKAVVTHGTKASEALDEDALTILEDNISYNDDILYPYP